MDAENLSQWHFLVGDEKNLQKIYRKKFQNSHKVRTHICISHFLQMWKIQLEHKTPNEIQNIEEEKKIYNRT